MARQRSVVGLPHRPRMALAGEDAVPMHPLPADRGVEVTDSVFDGPRPAGYDQAENGCTARKAVVALTMS